MDGGAVNNVLAYLYKFASGLFEIFGRLYIFNWFSPPVKEVVRNVRYASDNRKQALDIYIPYGEPPFPVMVYIHGGAFHLMDKRSYKRIARRFASMGYVVLNINYRLAPRFRFPAAYQDIDMAVAWARDNAVRYGGDAGRMVLAGDSAGATLSSMYTSALRSPELLEPFSIEGAVPPETIKGLLLFYGGYDMETICDTGFPFIKWLCEGFYGQEPQAYLARVEMASTARHVDPGYPPVFLASSDTDHLHTESVAFDQLLTEVGVPHKTLFFRKKDHPIAFKGHGFLSVSFGELQRISFAEARKFLQGLQ